MQTFTDVFDLWKTLRAMSAELDLDYERIRKWRTRNSIPAEYWALLLRSRTASAAKLKADHLVRMAAAKVA